jgi:hypothetical protein
VRIYNTRVSAGELRQLVGAVGMPSDGAHRLQRALAEARVAAAGGGGGGDAPAAVRGTTEAEVAEVVEEEEEQGGDGGLGVDPAAAAAAAAALRDTPLRDWLSALSLETVRLHHHRSTSLPE